MAAASLITSALLLVRLRPAWATDSSTIRAVATDHWNYGKWVAAGAGPNWVTENIYFIVRCQPGLARSGLERFKALLNLEEASARTVRIGRAA